MATLLSFPSIKSNAKGMLEYDESIIKILGQYADVQTTLFSHLLAEIIHDAPWIEYTGTCLVSRTQ